MGGKPSKEQIDEAVKDELQFQQEVFENQRERNERARKEQLEELEKQERLARQRGQRQVANAENDLQEVRNQRLKTAETHAKESGDRFVRNWRETSEYQEEVRILEIELNNRRQEQLEEMDKTQVQFAAHNSQIALENALDTMHMDILKEHSALMDRALRMKDATWNMTELKKVDKSKIKIHYDLAGCNVSHNTEMTHFGNQMRDLRNRMHRSFDVDQKFKEMLLSPLKNLENSCESTKVVFHQVGLAIQNNNPKLLKDVWKSLKDHLEITERTLEEVNSSQYLEQVRDALKSSNQLRSIAS